MAQYHWACPSTDGCITTFDGEESFIKDQARNHSYSSHGLDVTDDEIMANATMTSDDSAVADETGTDTATEDADTATETSDTDDVAPPAANDFGVTPPEGADVSEDSTEEDAL